ncbi:MAG: hypothetical protein UE970_06040 [Catenibacillus sp.]|nr:hypothetical protein [Catenibacillus sp.]
MYRLYKKSELNFSLVWIIAYVVLLSLADSLSDSLGTLKIITAPVCIIFTLLILGFIKKHNLWEQYGLCYFKGGFEKISVLYSAGLDYKRKSMERHYNEYFYCGNCSIYSKYGLRRGY